MFSNVSKNKSKQERLNDIQELQRRIIEQQTAAASAKSAIHQYNATHPSSLPQSQNSPTASDSRPRTVVDHVCKIDLSFLLLLLTSQGIDGKPRY